MADGTEENMNEKLQYIYAYDFFDTVVHRRCHPETVLYNWAKQCAEYLRYIVTPSQLYDVRKKTESEGKALKGVEEVPYDTLIRRTYRAALQGHDSIPSEDAFVHYSLSAEISAELREIYTDEAVLSQIRKLHEQGAEIILISDFYADGRYFDAIMQKLGIRQYFSKLYISADLNRRKSSGSLYRYVLEDLGIPAGRLIMTGDNAHSDVQIPESLGIHAHLIRNTESVPPVTEKVLKREIFRIFSASPAENPLAGYTGEILFFISALYRKLLQSGADHVLFCSREGQFIQELFCQYQTQYHPEHLISSSYFYISRRAVLLPSLNAADKETFAILFRQYKELTAADFLHNLGFGRDISGQILKSASLSETSVITAAAGDEAMQALKNSALFIREYEARRRQQHQFLLNYMSSLGIQMDKSSRVAIVDIGWKGTMQDCLRNALPEAVHLTGYYLGFVHTQEVSSKDKYGLVFTDYPQKCRGFDILAYKHTFFEKIFAADHGPVIGYRMDGSRAVPYVDDAQNNRKLYDFIHPQQIRLMDACNALAAVYASTRFEACDRPDLMLQGALYRHCICEPRTWQFRKKARSITVENFGNVAHINETAGSDRMRMTVDNRLFGYAEYTFQILDRFHLKILYPLAALYCRIVYGIWRLKIR